MRIFSLPMLLCLVVRASAGTESDSIKLADTNLIAFCASKSDVAVHVKVASLVLVRKPTETDVGDFSVYGRLLTFEVKRAYFWENIANSFPTNIYIYQVGAVGGSFLEPTLKVGFEYLVFLKKEKAPDILTRGTVTEPPLPATNYFTFVRLPQRQLPSRKAYMVIADKDALASVEKYLSGSTAGKKKP